MTEQNGHSSSSAPPAGKLTQLLAAVRAGEAGAVEEVVSFAYRELHALAQSRLRRAPRNALLDTTGLLHECYLRLIEVGDLRATDRRQFMAYASRVMRSIIVDTLRLQAARRRGGDHDIVPIDTELPDPQAEASKQILQVSEALDALRAVDERLVTIVEMRYFAGLGNQEIADILQINERTVRREWDKARALLYQEMRA